MQTLQIAIALARMEMVAREAEMTTRGARKANMTKGLEGREKEGQLLRFGRRDADSSDRNSFSGDRDDNGENKEDGDGCERGGDNSEREGRGRGKEKQEKGRTRP
ncbi:hypothetical protein ACLOJK_007127 [Asimina triloba]